MLTPLLTSDWEHAPDQSNDCTKSNSVSDEVLLWELVEIWVRGYYRGRQRWLKTHQLPHGKAHFNKVDDSWTLQPWSSLQMAQQPENLSPAGQLLSLFAQQLFTPSKVCVCVCGGWVGWENFSSPRHLMFHLFLSLKSFPLLLEGMFVVEENSIHHIEMK